MARFGVLGPLLVADEHGGWVRLRGDRQRSLLAMLLFHANQHVPTDRLVGALWQDAPPRSYASNLQTYVYRLRERIGPVRIEHASNGYRMWVDEQDLDLLMFRVESELGRRAARAGDPVAAAMHLRAALGQWRDHPLADLNVPALGTEVARLETERLATFEECVDAELAGGRHAELVGELEAAVAEHPLNERLAGQLMIALRRSGRQAEALAVYRRTRATLIEESGSEPGAELRAVHARILGGTDRAPERPRWPICQLPADIADFSGRATEVAELVELLGQVPLAVLSGEPGVGKSTLAVRVAHLLRPHFPDGQLFAHLAGASEPRAAVDVLADLLGTLGVAGPAIPDDLEARAALFRSRIADRRVLLVLDDAADPGQVRPLLPGTASSAVLVTSRRRLSGLAGAHRVPVPPLRDGDARLLLERIAGARVSREPAVAARIVAACGNLPLALRIAGTRLALRPELRPGTLADRLEDQLRRLDELTVSDLQVRSSLALSYRALHPPAQATLRLIGTVDIADLPAWAITVLRDGADSEAVIEELIEASLLEPAGEDRSGEPRYRMHDLIRAFAKELGYAEDPPADRGLAVGRLVDTGLALVDSASGRLPRTAPIPVLPHEVPAPRLTPGAVRRLLADPDAWLATERPSIMTGLFRLCQPGHEYRAAMLIFERFARYLWLHGQYADLRSGAETISSAAHAAGDEPIAARADAILALLLHVRGRYAEAVHAYRGCVARLSTVDDLPALAWTLNNLANCLIGRGQPEEALGLADRAAALFNGDVGVVSALRTRSAALHALGRAEEAVRVDTEALAIARGAGDPLLVALALQSLSWSLALTGELERAAGLVLQAVSLLRRTTARSALARSLRTLGVIHAGLGDRPIAVAAFHEARHIAQELNEGPRALSCTRAIAASWIANGRSDAAIPELRQCIAAYREMGSASAAAITLRLLAIAYDASGDRDAARAAAEQAERLDDPRDATARTVLRLLVNLTHKVP